MYDKYTNPRRRKRKGAVTKAVRDQAARKVTAFKDYADLVKSCRRNGYVPTLILSHHNDLKGDFAIQVLRRGLHQQRLRVWPDFGAYPNEHRVRLATEKK